MSSELTDMEWSRDASSNDADAVERLKVRLDEAAFQVNLSRETCRRLETEILRLEQRIVQIEADRLALRNRAEERDRYVAAIHRSLVWRMLQGVRGWFGRRW